MLQDVINKIVTAEEQCAKKKEQAEQRAYDIVLEAKNNAERAENDFAVSAALTVKNADKTASELADKQAREFVDYNTEQTVELSKQAERNLPQAIQLIIKGIG